MLFCHPQKKGPKVLTVIPSYCHWRGNLGYVDGIFAPHAPSLDLIIRGAGGAENPGALERAESWVGRSTYAFRNDAKL
jgi:hypothetical protein